MTGISSCRQQTNEMVGGLSDRAGDWDKDWDEACEVDWDETSEVDGDEADEVDWDEADEVDWDKVREEIGWESADRVENSDEDGWDECTDEKGWENAGEVGAGEVNAGDWEETEGRSGVAGEESARGSKKSS